MAVNGCDCREPQLARLISLAGQRFLTSIVNDALQIARRKLQAPVAARRAAGYNPKDKRLVLAAEDVAEALKEVCAFVIFCGCVAFFEQRGAVQ